eukprot:gene5937-33512_t
MMLKPKTVGGAGSSKAGRGLVAAKASKQHGVVRGSTSLAWLPKVAEGFVAGVLLTSQVSPADALSLTERQNQEAEEMAAIIRQRQGGRPLSSLTSSPNAPPAPAIKVDEGTKDVDAQKSQLDTKDVDALKSQLEGVRNQLQQEKQVEEAEAQQIRDLKARLQNQSQEKQVEEAEAQQISNLKARLQNQSQQEKQVEEAEAQQIRNLKARLQNQSQAAAQEEAREIQDLRAKLAAEEKLLQDMSKNPVDAEVSAKLAVPQSSSTTEAKTETDKESGDALGFLNVVGIFTAGGLGGYTFLQKKSAEDSQGELSDQLSKEKKLVEELKVQAQQVRDSLAKEEKVVAKLRQEMATVKDTGARLVEVEKKEKESAQRANDLASEALQAEKARVAAVQ